MRIRIIAPGLFGTEGAIPVGTEFEINGEIPPGWTGRVEIVKENPKPEAKAVTNPAKKPEAKG